jgi:ribonuclease HI
MANRGACKVAGFHMLGNTVCSLSHRHLHHLYKSVVISTITFGVPIWYTGIRQKILVDKLEKAQNNMLWQICGAFRTSPIAVLQTIASIPPLSLQLAHLRHGMATCLLKLQHNSTLLTRLSPAWRDGAPPQNNTPLDTIERHRRKFGKTNLDRISELAEPQSERIMPFVASPWWVRLIAHERFHFDLPSISRSTSNKKEKKKNEKECILEVIWKLQAMPDTIRVFTNGSLSEGKWICAGVGVSAWVNNARAFEHSVTSRCEATSYNAKMYVLIHGLSAAIQYASWHNLTHIVILSDCSAALQAILDYTPKPAQYLSIFFSKKVLSFLENPAYRISLYWTPSHCGIDGNKRADELAKKATQPNCTTVFDAPTIAFHKANSKKLMLE